MGFAAEDTSETLFALIENPNSSSDQKLQCGSKKTSPKILFKKQSQTSSKIYSEYIAPGPAASLRPSTPALSSAAEMWYFRGPGLVLQMRQGTL